MTELTRPSARQWLLFPAALALSLLWREVFPLVSLVDLAAGLGGPRPGHHRLHGGHLGGCAALSGQGGALERV